VHEDAERLEHAVSEKFIERIDAYLGFPHADPHGDPIPSAEGHIARPSAIPLDQCAKGDSITIARLRNDNPAFLLMMKEQDESAPTTPFTISIGNSAKIMVEPNDR
jgi:DtxR family transcriptional regulator, Mn-dependent transcriptional regulator